MTTTSRLTRSKTTTQRPPKGVARKEPTGAAKSDGGNVAAREIGPRALPLVPRPRLPATLPRVPTHLQTPPMVATMTVTTKARTAQVTTKMAPQGRSGQTASAVDAADVDVGRAIDPPLRQVASLPRPREADR